VGFPGTNGSGFSIELRDLTRITSARTTCSFAGKPNPTGSRHGVGTYLGTPDDDFASGIARDSSDNLYIVMFTSSDTIVASIGSAAPATATPVPTVQPTSKPKPAPTPVKKCKKGYHLVKGKCKKK